MSQEHFTVLGPKLKCPVEIFSTGHCFVLTVVI